MSNYYNRQWSFEVYTYFGRVLATFPIPDNETHHATAEKARLFMVEQTKLGVKCWSRLRK